MKGLAFADLDGTVISSKRNRWGDDHVPIAFNERGEATSFTNRQQRALLELLSPAFRLIPTTARDVADFRRVKLPFYDYAICSFGAVILTPAGEVEPTWHKLVSEQAAAARDSILAMVKLAAETAGALKLNVTVELMEDVGLALYVNIKQSQAGDVDRLLAAMRKHLPAGWTTHFNGNNLAFLPPFLGKEHAVKWFVDNLAGPHSMRIALGDSHSDLGFMALTHMAIAPVNSQIFSEQAATSSGDAPADNAAPTGKER